jgi:hypothetical protein
MIMSYGWDASATHGDGVCAALLLIEGSESFWLLVAHYCLFCGVSVPAAIPFYF